MRHFRYEHQGAEMNRGMNNNKTREWRQGRCEARKVASIVEKKDAACGQFAERTRVQSHRKVFCMSETHITSCRLV